MGGDAQAGGEGREAVSLFEPHVRLSAPSPPLSTTLIVERGTIAGGLSSPLRHETPATSHHQLLPL